jgi:anti-sigma B factor antagonist
MIRERKAGDVTILSIRRSVKGDGEAALKERLDALVAEGHLDILVDLKECPYLDSTELGRLIRCHLSVRRAGGRVRLCNLSPKVMMVLRVSRLDTVLDVFETEDQALATMGNGGSGRAASGAG